MKTMLANVVMLVLAAQAVPADESALPKDSQARIAVQVEVKGVLVKTSKGVFVKYRHQVTVIPGQGDTQVKSSDAMWELDLSRLKPAPDIDKLLGKPVLVTGTAELQLVVYEGTPRPRINNPDSPSSTWQIGAKIRVAELTAYKNAK